MADHTPQRAIVIGGSLGGLFAAAALREIGWTVDVYERSVNELDSRGGGIVMQRDLLEAFRFAGFAHGPQFSVPSRDRQFLVASGAARFRQRMPQAQTAWNVLYNTLRAGLPEGVVHAGLALSGIEQDGARVEAILPNGERARAHLF